MSAARGALRWLAVLHGTFMADTGLLHGAATEAAAEAAANRLGGIWPQAQYFHLGTRAAELQALPTGCTLRRLASQWDRQLRAAPQTVCHGDAKLPNFLFRPTATSSTAEQPTALTTTAADTVRDAAAVDFQYAGVGCGMSDVAYLLHSTVGKAFPAAPRDGDGGLVFPRPKGYCRADAAAEAADYAAWRSVVDPLVEYYLGELRRAIDACRSDVVDTDAVVTAYRGLLEPAYLDYWRFYMGWAAPMRPSIDASDEEVLAAAPGFVRHMAGRQADYSSDAGDVVDL
uniref:Aminoglycoside phosphotransferase domain-containing protein n=1 Tax=Neobodo designis TaxID=312471 RepID=A0A7S1LUC5_NEODS